MGIHGSALIESEPRICEIENKKIRRRVSLHHPSKKLAHKFLGPYVIEHRVGPSACWLQLPRSLNWLHPVFPVVKLLPALEDPIPGRQSKPPPDPILVDGEEHYEVEAILDSRMSRGRLQFLIQWKDYSYEHNSWENATDVHSSALVNEFYSTHMEPL